MNVKIVVPIKGKDVEFTLEEAKKLFGELKSIFGEPVQPFAPPVNPNPYHPIYPPDTTPLVPDYGPYEIRD